jgi:hypothetical protein
MLVVLMNPHDFHFVTALSPDESFNGSWSIDQNLVFWFEVSFDRAGVQSKKLIVQVDKAPVHNSRMTRNFFKHNPLKRLPHPPYSLDIYLSDFYLFWKITEALIGQEIPDEISLLDAMTEILNEISIGELQHIFHSWIKRVENVIIAEGGSASS